MRWFLVLAITLAAGQALAHVAPSVDDNNRYLKVTPAADGVRIAYTVFFGEIPGQQTRRTIDADHDGVVTEPEAQAFGDKLATEVADSLELTVDGTTHKVRWSTVAVGLGDSRTIAGAFSVDLISWVCLPTAGGRHALLLRDRFRVPRPGETEVRVEDGHGITLHHARVGRANDATHDYRFVGPGGPLSDDGLDLAFTVTAEAPRSTTGACRAGIPAAPRPRSWPIALAVSLGLGVAAIGMVVAIRARRR